MVDRLRWWWIPAGLVVLIGTVALPGRIAVEPPAPAVRDAVAVADRAVLQDATGRRTTPMPFGELRAGALVIALPAACRGLRGTMTLWRRADAGREATPWLSVPAGPREDGIVPIAGLAAGRYDLEFAVEIDGGRHTFVADDAAAPGEIELVDALAR
jgi:hypothetical protein